MGLARKSNLGKPLQRRGSPPVNGAKGTGTICANCQTTSTPLWRKDRPSGTELAIQSEHAELQF